MVGFLKKLQHTKKNFYIYLDIALRLNNNMYINRRSYTLRICYDLDDYYNIVADTTKQCSK